MSEIYFSSDHHLGHANILTFKNYNGTPLRIFDNVDAMNDCMINRHNAIVKPQDKVYFLGDVVINKKYLPLLERFNGHKRLVRGNHDIEDTSIYMKYFEDIYGVRVFSKEKFICSHIPIHPDCLSRWKVNVHGHLHGNKILERINLEEFKPAYDKRYLSVCMEQIDYTPIHIDVILNYIKELQ